MPTNVASWIPIRFSVIFLTAFYMTTGQYVQHHRRFQALPSQGRRYSPRVYSVTSYGADPSGETDSTEAIMEAFNDAVSGSIKGRPLMKGITNLGGPHINLEGGMYTISRPLQFQTSSFGNLLIHGGSIQASNNFPANSFLIELSKLSSSPPSESSYDFEFITFSDLFLDCNYNSGGISVINAVRTIIQNCYISRFRSTGILVSDGHETYISNSFLGQHPTAGKDPEERDFSGIAISLFGNDNAVTDVVIFSAAVGIRVTGQGNILTGVHCYNKATGFGGVGIYIALPENSQTRIVNCYMDYTGIVAEDPVQLHISDCFFLGDAFISLKSLNGIARGVKIVHNIFSGSGKGIPIVSLNDSVPFTDIDQVEVARNSVRNMSLKSTVATGYAEGSQSIWTFDFGAVLLFPDRILNVEYSFALGQSGLFPKSVIRSVSENRVVIESDVAVNGSVFVAVDQGTSAAVGSS